MANKGPSKPTRAKGPTRPHHTATPMSTPMERSYSQKLRTDRAAPFESAAKRAAFWANRQKALENFQTQEMNQNVASIAQGTVTQTGTTFASANIQSATLQSALPAVPGDATFPGLGQGGIAPPPPPP